MFEWSSYLCWILIAGVSAAGGSGPIRKPVVSGMFYPSDPGELRRKVQQFLDQAVAEALPGRLVAIIVPHAGYDYSGGVAAHAFKLLQGQSFKRVVILSPSHRVAFNGISIYPKGAFETPLGPMPVDAELALEVQEAMLDEYERLQYKGGTDWDERLGLGYYAPAHAQEHAIEVEIPFLQVVLPEAKIVPIVVGAQDSKTVARLTRMFIRLMQRPDILFVLSVDLSHYHPYQEAVRLDKAGLEAVEQLDAAAFVDRYNAGKTEWDCPAGVVALLQAADSLNARAKLIKYANSGDVTGEKFQVVGYSAVQIALPPREPDAGWLNEEEQKELLEIAWNAVKNHVMGRDPNPTTVQHERLKQKGMAFVTLEKGGQLRGCIGFTEPLWPLYETVVRAAVAAASQDPRFSPVQRSELDELDLEISVLTPLRELQRWRDITIGVHGLVIEKGGRRGLLLPQVATEYGWTRIEFLRHVCQKASLPTDAWQAKDAKLYTFTAQVFHR